ncbi:nuclear transport factor 2 family protein [Rhodococcus koreensis]
MPSIEERLIRLEDIERIRRLKAEYCNVCDDHHDPDAVVRLFAADGVWEADGLGAYRGHDEIRRAFERFGRSIRFSQHNTTNLDITVTGNTACGTWHFVGVVDFHDGPTRLTLARYDERYVKIDGEWKFAHLSAVRLAHHELPDLQR